MRKTNGKPLLNVDLWERLLAARKARTGTTTWQHVYGHTNVPWNVVADKLAVAAKGQAAA